MSSTNSDPSDAIAIIGMSCRFPGAQDVNAFWRNLRDGVESIARFTPADLASAGIDPAVTGHPDYVNARGVLEQIDMFDAAFFGFSPREAEILDPQQRLFLECAWEALEGAGYDPDRYPGLIGVYGGVGLSKYLFQLYANPNLVALLGPYQISLANDKDHLTTRTAYKLNLKGPAVTIQTACSTSLVAVCLACQSLLDFQCDMVLAGGSSIEIPQGVGYIYQEGGIASPDGHCRAFDAAAQGTVGGNGVGVVLLKRLEDALEDRDTIHAVILGAAINNDGSVKIGYTAPSVEGQVAAITMAQAVAGIDPATIAYVETHGTGTSLGDPIEVAALTQAFRANTPQKHFCAIGSVKTNVGHLDTAAGVASLIKTVLALEHQMLPPSLHFQVPNPKIDFANSPFYVNTLLAEWPADRTPRRAAVSAFGIGGTNAHVVLQEAPPVAATSSPRSHQLLLLSARTPRALEAMTADLARHLRQHAALDLADVAYTCHIGRRAFDHRRMVVCRDSAQAAQLLEVPNPRRVFSDERPQGDRQVAFLFPGQGAQYVDMAAGLYRSEPVFAQHLDRCAQLLSDRLGLDLRRIVYPTEGSRSEAEAQLQQTGLTQPALFAVEYALAQLWMAWGLKPSAMIGHSIGEYVAGCLAGVFSLQDALALVAARGRLMQQQPGGAMLAVALGERELSAVLDERVSIAALNAPQASVVSGPADTVARLADRLAGRGVACRQLRISHAFHSAMMDPMLDAFREQVQSVRLQPPRLPFISNVTGNWIGDGEATDPDYWVCHARRTVHFSAGVRQLLQTPHPILLEVGPGRTLTTLAQQQADRDVRPLLLASLRHPLDPQADTACLLTTLGRLWLAGAPVDWTAYHAHEKRRRVSLPTYPFERERFWIEAPKASGAEPPVQSPSAPLAKRDRVDWFFVPAWQKIPMPAVRADGSPSPAAWLVFTAPGTLPERIGQRLRRQAGPVISVAAGRAYARLDDHTYTIDPSRSEDYVLLLQGLQAAGRLPAHIVHLWCLAPAPDAPAGFETLEAAMDLGFFSLIHLAQAIGKLNGSMQFQITAVTHRMQVVTGNERVDPEKALLLGPCRVIPQEYDHIQCRSVDIVVPEADEPAQDQLVEQILAEIDSEAPAVCIAYRDGQRWTQAFKPIRFDEAGPSRIPLRQAGVYLITGGLGGIGYTLARYLAQSVQAKLVLVGRTALPVREQWPSWLADHPADEPTARKIHQVQALARLGSEVMVAAADVADMEAMRSLVQDAKARFGPLHGLIHAAGLPGGGIVQLKTREQARRVLSPKVAGTLVLERLLGQQPLDFFLLCSSLASILGGAGQVDYCAANAFLDAFAQGACARGLPVVAVNWDRWLEVGMAADFSAPHDLQQSWPGIRPEEGVEVFRQVLQRNFPQVAILTGDERVYLYARPPRAGATSGADDAASGSAQATHARPALANAYTAPATDVEKTLIELFEALLGVKPVGVHDNFFELGGHSLLAIQLTSRLRDEFDLDLPMQTIFEAPTPAEQARAIETIRWAAQAGTTPQAPDDPDREAGEI